MNLSRLGKLLLFIVFPASVVAEAHAIDFISLRDSLTPEDAQMEGFPAWLQQRRTELADDGTHIAKTSRGPIQYLRRGKGPVVICLHGMFGGYDQSFLMGSFLVNKGFTVIAVSRPGYLGTPISVGRSVEAQADATVALMDALKIEKATIFGFSAGSPVAFQVGVRHPERCSSVILSGVGLQENQASEYSLLELFLKKNIGVDLPPYGLYLLTQKDFPAALGVIMGIDTKLKGAPLSDRVDYILGHPSQLAWARALAVSLTPLSDRRKGLIADCEAVSTWSTYEALFATYQPPVLFVDSKNDNSGSYGQTRRIASKIHTSRLIPVEDSGHFIWLGANTAKWQAQMISYLRKHKN